MHPNASKPATAESNAADAASAVKSAVTGDVHPANADAAAAGDADAQRDALLESERRAHAQQPRNFKDDALTDKLVQVAPDGTGPTPTDSFDAPRDQALGSGNEA